MDAYTHRGRLKGLGLDFSTGEVTFTLCVKGQKSLLEEEYNGLLGKDLTISLEEYSDDRSLTANAYFHVLCRLIGRHKDIKQTETYVKNMLIASDGQPELLKNGEYFTFLSRVPLTEMWEQSAVRVRLGMVDIDEEGEVYTYEVRRPSHTYTKKEMAQLIDGAVRQAHELGIPTMSDAELEHLISLWKPRSKE